MQKIMVFRFSAMGDIAMTVPVIKTLISQNKDVKIIMVSRPFFAPFFKDITQIKFIGVDLNNQYKGLPGLLSLFQFLRQEKPNTIVDLHDVLRTKVLRTLFRLNGYKISTIDKGRKEKKALTRSKNKIFAPLKTTHQHYADAFKKLGYTINLAQFTPLKPELPTHVKLFLQNFTNSKLIGIAPFAAHIGKQYPLDKIKTVIQQLLIENEQINIILFGSPSEKKDLDILEKINRNRIVNIAGVFSFEEELALISRLDLMISMDSGNAHIAALYGIPVISIWGATHPYAGFAPLGQNSNLQITADRKQFPQIPTSIYGNKTFQNFEKIWETIPPEKIVQTILKNI